MAITRIVFCYVGAVATVACRGRPYGTHLMSLHPYTIGLVVVLWSSCASSPVDVVFYRDNGQRFSWAERWRIESIAEDTVTEVANLLPSLPEALILRVHQGPEVVRETGDYGGSNVPNIVYWTVDPSREEGISAIARERLRTTLYHHLFYLARRVALDEPRTVLNESVAFGLAAAFARDFGGSDVPWNTYPPATVDWVVEVLAVADEPPSNDWMSRLPDGRRLVGPRVGFLLVDRAVAASGRSVADLVAVPTKAIVAMVPEASR